MNGDVSLAALDYPCRPFYIFAFDIHGPISGVAKASHVNMKTPSLNGSGDPNPFFVADRGCADDRCAHFSFVRVDLHPGR
jgi:hypothetical protein